MVGQGPLGFLGSHSFDPASTQVRRRGYSTHSPDSRGTRLGGSTGESSAYVSRFTQLTEYVASDAVTTVSYETTGEGSCMQVIQVFDHVCLKTFKVKG